MLVNRIYWSLTILLLIIFGIGLFKNLGNIAFWGDEGETVQMGKSILKFGYPSVFDGRSFFIILTDKFNKQNYAKYDSPYLQHYIAAFALKFNDKIADPFIIRFPFVSIAFIGILSSVILLFRQKYSSFTIFLYMLMITTSVQLYLYYRQVRHYALQFPLALGFIYSYFYLNKRLAQVAFIVFGFLLYNAFYPGFFAIYLSLIIHFFIRVIIYKQKIIIKPFLVCSFVLAGLLFPIYIYLQHYNQAPWSGYFQNMRAFFYDLNYLAYLKIFFVSLLFIIFTKLIKFKIKCLRALSYRSIPRNHWLFLSLIIVLIPIYPAVISFGRHNQRYISVLLPFAFFLIAYFWDYILSPFDKSGRIKIVAQIVSIPLLLYLILVSHPGFLSQLMSFKGELSSTYAGPIEGIVNTITGFPYGRINAYNSQRPNLLIATNAEVEAVYAYLGSQFLDHEAFGIYKYGVRKPDWVIPRHISGKNYYDNLINTGDYEKIQTDYCDTELQQVYSVKTHHYKTITDCPDRKLILYKLK